MPITIFHSIRIPYFVAFAYYISCSGDDQPRRITRCGQFGLKNLWRKLVNFLRSEQTRPDMKRFRIEFTTYGCYIIDDKLGIIVFHGPIQDTRDWLNHYESTH